MKYVKIIAGPLLGIVTWALLHYSGVSEPVARMAGITLWMAAWWMTEAIPLAMTALLPMVLFPVLNIMGAKSLAHAYMDDVIFLFMGGFIMAFAMERWNLHRRIALRIILLLGSNVSRILLGLMVATYILSMWMSNTATTMMMIPTTLAVITKVEDITGRQQDKLSIGLLLGIAYAANIGGTATLVGTPPNMVLVSQFGQLFPEAEPISFLRWFSFGLPLSLVFFVIAYFYLRKRFVKYCHDLDTSDIRVFHREMAKLGKIKFEEVMVIILFSIMVLLWFTRADITIGSLHVPGWNNLFADKTFVTDGLVAILMSLLLFLIPARNKQNTMLISWREVKKLPLDIILLFGGGFALATGFEESGLGKWLAGEMAFVGGLPIIVSIVILCTVVVFTSEFASNLATAQLMLPLVGALAVQIGQEPLLLMVPVTFAATYAFMMPVGTPPNMIVFGTERIPMQQFIRTGIVLNLVGIVLTTALMLTLGVWLFGL